MAWGQQILCCFGGTRHQSPSNSVGHHQQLPSNSVGHAQQSPSNTDRRRTIEGLFHTDAPETTSLTTLFQTVRILVVGKSGSGKTTLIRLLLGDNGPQDIGVHGLPVQHDIDHEWLWTAHDRLPLVIHDSNGLDVASGHRNLETVGHFISDRQNRADLSSRIHLIYLLKRKESNWTWRILTCGVRLLLSVLFVLSQQPEDVRRQNRWRSEDDYGKLCRDFEEKMTKEIHPEWAKKLQVPWVESWKAAATTSSTDKDFLMKFCFQRKQLSDLLADFAVDHYQLFLLNRPSSLHSQFQKDPVDIERDGQIIAMTRDDVLQLSFLDDNSIFPSND